MNPDLGERAGSTRVGVDRCRNLRWKGLYMEAVWDPAIPHGNDLSFWFDVIEA